MRTTFRNFSITATYLGNKSAGWGMPENCNNHRVSVHNSRNGKRITFEFWASLAEPELRKPSDLRGAFECFLFDAISGKQSFEDFCGEFGYDHDSRNAEKTWKGCQRAAAKADRLLGGMDLYDLVDKLRELE